MVVSGDALTAGSGTAGSDRDHAPTWLARARLLALTCALLIVAAAGAQAQQRALQRYAQALQAELSAMQLAADCVLEAERYDCSFAAPSAPDLRMHAVYSDQTDTVYVYIERYATLPADDVKSTPALRHMMELNWQLLVGKLEWSARTGEVRLSAVLNTDSNFDRRALRSIVSGLDLAAARYRGELGAGE